MTPAMWGLAMLVPDSTAYVLVGNEDRTPSPGATMSGLTTRVPMNEAGPRLLNPAREFDIVVAATENDASYWAGGPSLPIVRQVGPELPAEKTGTMPAARRAVTASYNESCAQPSWEIEQNQELLTATGARSGFGFWPSRFQGAI